MNLDNIKASRNKGCVIFAKFTQEKRNNKNCLFCFFEGEDIKYYSSRIQKYTGYDYKNTVTYNCRGKKEVLKAYDLIQNDNNESIKKAFFIDKDFENNYHLKNEIYITPGYSIENFYTSDECFSKILCSEFGFNYSDEEFKTCLKDYKARKKEFHEGVTLLNSIIACQITTPSSIVGELNLDDLKLTKLFSEISIDKIKYAKTIDYNTIISFFPKVIVDEDLVKNKAIEFSSKNKSLIFRGKFELFFLVKIIDSLKEKNRKGNYFTEKHNCVKIDPNINTLSTLSAYADTPICLKEFLNEYQSCQ